MICILIDLLIMQIELVCLNVDVKTTPKFLRRTVQIGERKTWKKMKKITNINKCLISISQFRKRTDERQVNKGLQSKFNASYKIVHKNTLVLQ